MAWAMGVVAGEPADVRLTGDWRVTVTVAANESPLSATLDVAPPEWVTVTDERYEKLRDFNPQAPGWAERESADRCPGARMHGQRRCGCRQPGGARGD